jgi:hypothetical protein
MTIKGQITSLLKPEYLKAGYSLTSDDHFVYLHYGGKIIKTFNGHAKTIEPVETFIKAREELKHDDISGSSL